MKIGKKIPIISFLILLLMVISVVVAHIVIKKSAENLTFDSPENIPKQKVGLLLGTGKFLANGRKNAYFFNRIDATVELYQSGKIEKIIISGDNSEKGYNEPEDMQQELILRGIPQKNIYLDFAGFRTLDSVVRAKNIFGQNQFTIISQKFHNERALFLAQQNDITAYGYNAKDVHQYAGIKTKIREYFARVKVFVDLILGVEPKFNGEKILIE